MKLSKLEKSWILYDVGNSAFTMLACSLIPIWFKSIAIGDPGQGFLTSDQATGSYSLIITIATIMVAFLSPIIGTINDSRKLKKFLFTTFVSIGVICCFLNAFTNSWLVFLIVFLITRVSFNLSQCSYDSMLVDITTEERMDEVSSHGFAWGYIGSCAPFIVALVFYVLADPGMGISLIAPETARIIGCSVTAGWWFIVTLPLIKNYKQTHYTGENGAIKNVFMTLGGTFKKIIKGDKRVFLFLAAYFLYIDGVGTIIDNCVNVGTDLGLDTVGQVIFLLATQVVAFVFSLIFARLSRKYSTTSLIQVCIAGYFLVCIYALFLTQLYQFAIMAFGVGMFQGSIQSLSRSYFAKIIPPDSAGEYFGIYDIFCKGASFLGSAVIAAVKFAGGTVNIALGLLAIFFLGGFFLLRAADRA